MMFAAPTLVLRTAALLTAVVAAVSCSTGVFRPSSCKRIVFTKGPSIVLPEKTIESINTLVEGPVERIISVRLRVPPDDKLLREHVTAIRVRASDLSPAEDVGRSQCRALGTSSGEVCEAALGDALTVTILLTFTDPPAREILLAAARDHVQSSRAACEP